MSQHDPPKFDKEVHVGWVETILNEGINLTEWEQNFVNDLHERFEHNMRLTSRKQEVILERIYADRTP